jgi:proline racemase
MHEGVLGTLMQGRVLSRQPGEEMPAVQTLVEGSASITGFHEFVD